MGFMKRMRKLSVTMIISVIIFFGIMIGGEVFFQTRANKRTSEMACSMMVGQIEDIISSNEANVSVLMDALKDEYIIRAKAVSYILENGSTDDYTVEEYKKIAALLQVDEIHIFDLSGTIVDGSNPEYYGLSFDSGEQISFFKPMLSDKSLSMCQDITPNTAEGKSMMYANVWRSDGTGIIQVGITPDRLLDEMKNNDISEIAKSFPVSDGMEIFIINAETSSLVGCTSPEATGKKLSESLNFDGIAYGNRYSDTADINGDHSYITYEKYKNYIIAVSQTVSSANNTILTSTVLISISLIIALCILLLVIKYAYKQILLRQAMEIHQQELEFISYHDSLTGALNRHALYERTDKFELGSCQGVIFGDIMGLKKLNDSKGHEAGDALIKNIYRTMLRHFPTGDVFRIGGDEFIILSGASTEEELHRKKDLLSSELDAEGNFIALGCAWTDDYSGNYGELERSADNQMYEYKKAFYKEHPEFKR